MAIPKKLSVNVSNGRKVAFVPTPETQKYLDTFREQGVIVVQQELRQGMIEIVDDATWRSADNAPIFWGHLRGSLKADVDETTVVDEQPVTPQSPHRSAQKRTDVIMKPNSNTAVTGVIYSNLPYALRRHEDTYSLGPISTVQPMTPEGGTGAKFITRTIDFHLKQYTERLIWHLDEMSKRLLELAGMKS